MGLLEGNYSVKYKLFVIIMCFIFKGLDRGQCSDEDIERIKKLVPDMFKKHIESMYWIIIS